MNKLMGKLSEKNTDLSSGEPGCVVCPDWSGFKKAVHLECHYRTWIEA